MLRVTLDQLPAAQPDALFSGDGGARIRAEMDRLAQLMGEVVDPIGETELRFTVDMAATIDELTGQAPGSYSPDKGTAGRAAARTVEAGGRPVVVVDLDWIAKVLPDQSFDVNREGAELMTHTVIHEAQHALMMLNGTTAGAAGLSYGIDWDLADFFVGVASVMLDEFRAERGARRDGDESIALAEFLPLLAVELDGAWAGFTKDGDVRRFAIAVLNAAGAFWVTGLGYAAGKGTRAPEAAAWDKLVGARLWQSLLSAFEGLPPADATGTRANLEAVRRSHAKLVRLLPELLNQHGYDLRASPDGGGMMFHRIVE